MKRLLIALFLASSMVAIAQAPPAPVKATQTKAEKKAEKKAAKKAEKKAAKEAKAATAAPTQAVKPAPLPVPAAKPGPAAKASPAPKVNPSASAIVANKDSKTFHRADCTYVVKMKAANRVSFANAAEAAKAGYKPCKVCKPQ